jgi:NADH-quinone oxidoreductase subunit G
MLEIEIDGVKLEVEKGSTVLDATNQLGVYVPHFCYHKKLSIAANCRMCLVEVEKAPKPLPACATPVTDGMRVFTQSKSAKQAQNAVMEFLLINHPLDCPICDQGGECQLQDLAVGYGGSQSRYQEAKRVVSNKQLGPLIATDMTRCIHCTRCVRFGQEVGGDMELGLGYRGEHAEIMPFIERTVDSELSGNMIDLCPVGALTSKPFRFSARTWELTRRASISPHCGLGSNLQVQVKLNRVVRVLPRENDAVNECWLSDKDRFSYEALNSEHRLTRPLLREGGGWREVDWPTALAAVSTGLRDVCERFGPEQLAALGSPYATLEELYLLQKLCRALGSGNVDFRTRQGDFRADKVLAGAPWLGMPVAEISSLDRLLVVGSNLRKDHPLIAQRVRRASRRLLKVSAIGCAIDDWRIPLKERLVAPPDALVEKLGDVLRALATAREVDPPANVAKLLSSSAIDPSAQAIGASLAAGRSVAVWLGNLAQHHPRGVELHALGEAIAQLVEGKFGFIGEAANSAGGYLARAVPFATERTGANAREMFAAPRRGYVILHAEPELDCFDSAQAMAALRQAEFVVALSPFLHRAQDYAHVILPVAPFTETAGSFVNCEGRVQSFSAVVQPLGDTRPAWKLLRQLGSQLQLPGFDVDDIEALRSEFIPAQLDGFFDNGLRDVPDRFLGASSAWKRFADVGIHHADPLARRAPALQASRDGAAPVAGIHGRSLESLGLRGGEEVRLRQGGNSCVIRCERDDGLPENCVRLPAGHSATAALGPMFGPIEVERA